MASLQNLIININKCLHSFNLIPWIYVATSKQTNEDESFKLKFSVEFSNNIVYLPHINNPKCFLFVGGDSGGEREN